MAGPIAPGWLKTLPSLQIKDTAMNRPPTSATPEEQEFAREYANELARAFVVMAAEPDRQLGQDSIAARLKPAYQRLVNGPWEKDARERARQLLQSDSETRRRYFGTAGEVGSDAQRVAINTGLTKELREKLRSAIMARLSVPDPALQAIADRSIALNGDSPAASKTKLYTGEFSGDVITEPKTSTIITTPDSLEFRWTTTEAGAEYGVWSLYEVEGNPLKAYKLLAQGDAGLPGERFFRIDMKKWLPSTPPETGVKFYEVRVGAYRLNKKLGVGASKKGAAPPKLVPELLGSLSMPVTITYRKSDAPALLFPGGDAFRDLKFSFGDLEVNVPQGGSDFEEYRVLAFLIESRGDGTDKIQKFDSYEQTINLEEKDTIPLDMGAHFDLPDPDHSSWPRIYTLFVTAAEIDSGSSVADWLKDTFGVIKDTILAQVKAMFEEIIEDLRKAGKLAVLAAVFGGGGLAALALGATKMATILAQAASATMIAIIVALAIMIIYSILMGFADDPYGAVTDVVVLPHNLCAYLDPSHGKWLEDNTQFEVYGTASGYGQFADQEPGMAAVGGRVSIDWSFLLKDRYYWFA